MARIKEEDLRLNLIINGDETRKNMASLRGEITKTKSTISDLEKERKKLVKQYGEESNQVKTLDKELNAHRSALKNLQSNYADYERRLSITGMTMKELASHARTVSATLRNLKPGTPEFTKYNEELRKTKDRMRELKTQAGDTGKAMKGLAGIKAGWAAAAGVVAGLTKVFGSAVNTMKDFEQANVNLSTILGVNVKEMEDLTNEAMRLGGSTRYTASEVTALQTELAKLGFNKGQIKAMEEPVLNFATAVGADLPEAAALAGATLRMFELSATDTEDTLAALALSTNKSALNFGYLQSAMSTVGPVAKTFGFSVKDTTALLGVLANSGFDASSAATATRNIFLKLADANGDLAKSLGGPVSNFDELISGLQTLDAKGIDLATTLELTDKRSVAAFNSFLRGADSAAELRNELELTDGALKELAETRMNTLEGSVLSLKSAWERFVLTLRGTTGVLKSIVDYTRMAIQGITDLVSGGQISQEKAVDGLVEYYKTTFDSAEEAAEAANAKLLEYMTAADALKERLAATSDKKEKKRQEKALKELEKNIAQHQSALGRLVMDDTATTSTGTVSTGSAPTSSSATTSGGSDSGKKSWNLSSDEAYLKEKASITRRYNDGEIASETEFQEAMYQAEQSAYKARLALGKESGADRAKIEADMQDSTLKHNQEVQKKNEESAKKEEERRKKFLESEKAAAQLYISISETHEERAKAQEAAEDLRFETEMEGYEKNKETIKDYEKVVEAAEKQHQNNLRKIRIDAIEAEKKDLDTRYKTIIAKIQEEDAYELNLATTPAHRKAEIQRKQASDTAAANLAYIESQISIIDKIVETEDSNLTKEQKAQYAAMLAELRKQLAEAKANVDNLSKKGGLQNLANLFKGGSGGSLFGISQSDWDQLFLNLEKGTLSAKDMSTILGGIGGAAQEGYKLAAQAIKLVNDRENKEYDEYVKIQDDKKEKLKKRLDSGLMSQVQYDAEIERMEKEQQQKSDDMKLQQAQREKKLAIVQATIDSALATLKTFVEFGGWPAGVVPAAIMAALGAAQVAMISATPVGYAEGGLVSVNRAQDGKGYKASVAPGRRGFIGRPTILVGEDGMEYVVPADGVSNPSIAPVLAQIENARRMGTLKSLNLSATYPAQTCGLASGGYVTQGTPSGRPSAADIPEADMSEVKSMLGEILVKMDNPIPAIMTMTGLNGFEEVFNKRQQQLERGKIKP
ncbi:MAG: phage tail tape measure protein [Bacteroidales bacterium]|nr:phage tail tape measure protein [Bacteroidales bacterium]